MHVPAVDRPLDEDEWRDFVAAPDVVMIGLDAAVTSIDLTNEDATQVARGSVVVDHDGTRQATAMFAPGMCLSMKALNFFMPSSSAHCGSEASLR